MKYKGRVKVWIVIGCCLFSFFLLKQVNALIKVNYIDIPKKIAHSDNIIEEKYKKIPVIEGEKIEIGVSKAGYPIYTINGVFYVSDYLIVNKTYPLPANYVPINTYHNASGMNETCNTCIDNIAYKAFLDMQADARSLGLDIKITSGYRSYENQKRVYDAYIARDGEYAADTYSARPGYSEHQSGLCFDLNEINDTFGDSNEGIWVDNNAYRYGFIIRFPKNKEQYTGYKYESWHLRYVGEYLAKILYNEGDWISLEEYFGIESEYIE